LPHQKTSKHRLWQVFQTPLLVIIEHFIFTIEEDDDANYENVLAGIRELYATLTNVDGLKKDSISLDPKFGMSQDKESSEVIQDLESVIEYSNSEDIRQGNL
jgi:hypothetical protein